MTNPVMGKIYERSIEASELGLPAGVWPSMIRYQDDIWYRCGHGVRDMENELLFHVYQNRAGELLQVFND